MSGEGPWRRRGRETSIHRMAPACQAHARATSHRLLWDEIFQVFPTSTIIRLLVFLPLTDGETEAQRGEVVYTQLKSGLNPDRLAAEA